jgi:hypothetical protein
VEPTTQGLINTKTPPVPFPQEPINKQGAAIQTGRGQSETHPAEAQDTQNQQNQKANKPWPQAQQKQYSFPAPPVAEKTTALAFDANAKPIYPGMRVKLVGIVVGVNGTATHFDGVHIKPLHNNIHDSRIGSEYRIDPSQLEVGD